MKNNIMDTFCENKFRKLEKSDYTNFYFLINQLQSTELSKSDFESMLDYMNNTDTMETWVIEKFDKASGASSLIGSGTIIYEKKFIHNCGKAAHIEDIVICKTKRHCGLGKELIQFLLNKAHENYCYKVILNCNEAMEPFYEKCGLTQKNIQMAKYFS